MSAALLGGEPPELSADEAAGAEDHEALQDAPRRARATTTTPPFGPIVRLRSTGETRPGRARATRDGKTG